MEMTAVRMQLPAFWSWHSSPVARICAFAMAEEAEGGGGQEVGERSIGRKAISGNCPAPAWAWIWTQTKPSGPKIQWLPGQICLMDHMLPTLCIIPQLELHLEANGIWHCSLKKAFYSLFWPLLQNCQEAQLSTCQILSEELLACSCVNTVQRCR